MAYLMLRKFCLIYFFLSLIGVSHSKSLKIEGLSRLDLLNLNSLTSIDLNASNFDLESINIIQKDLYNSNLILNIDYTENEKEFILIIDEAPKIKNIFINGNKLISDNDILTFLSSKENSILEKSKISNDLILIENLYNNKGYFNNSINVVTEKYNDENVNLIFEIIEEQTTVMNYINFKGNETFSSKFLKSKIKSNSNSSLFFFSSGSNISESLIENDKLIIQNLYKKKGFFNSQVNYNLIRNNFNSVSLVFFIDEGQRTIVENIAYNFSAPLNSLNEIINLKDELDSKIKSDESFFDYDLFQIYIEKFDLVLSNNNINKKVEFDFEVNNFKANIQFKDTDTLNPLVNQINIFGNSITKNNVLLSKIEISPGDYLSEKKINDSKKNLSDLKYVNKVESDINKIDNKVDINFTIDENKKTGTILAGGNFNADQGAGVVFKINDSNLFGTGNELNTNFALNSEQLSIDLIYKSYSLNSPNIYSLYSVQNEEIDYSDTLGFKIYQQGIGYKLGFDLTENSNFAIGYRFNQYKGHSPENEVDQTITDSIGNFINNVFTIGYIFENTNDILYPSSGSRYSLNFEYAPDQFSNDSYLKTKINSDNYFKLNNSSSYFFISSSYGYAQSLNDNNLKTKNSFSLGGSSFKGFKYKGVGQKTDNNFNYGGNQIFTSTIGYGSTFIFEDKDNIYTKIFYSFGSLWDDDYIDQSFELRSSIGISLDVLTPVGPISFSYAIPIQKNSEDETRRFNFSIGTAF